VQDDLLFRSDVTARPWRSDGRATSACARESPARAWIRGKFTIDVRDLAIEGAETLPVKRSAPTLQSGASIRWRGWATTALPHRHRCAPGAIREALRYRPRIPYCREFYGKQILTAMAPVPTPRSGR
jgi:hypothetical protein